MTMPSVKHRPITMFVWSKRREPYHLPSCKSVQAMRERNRTEGTLAAAADERRPCKRWRWLVQPQVA